MKEDVKKVLSYIILDGFLCPVYAEIDRDTREEWED